MKVLVLDDEHTVTNLVSQVLRKNNGIIVDAFVNPKIAAGAIQSTKYDVIITDISMPDISGYEVIDIINEYNPEAKIFIMTGHDLDKVKCDTAYEIIQKPFCVQTLLEKVKGLNELL